MNYIDARVLATLFNGTSAFFRARVVNAINPLDLRTDSSQHFENRRRDTVTGNHDGDLWMSWRGVVLRFHTRRLRSHLSLIAARAARHRQARTGASDHRNREFGFARRDARGFVENKSRIPPASDKRGPAPSKAH